MLLLVAVFVFHTFDRSISTIWSFRAFCTRRTERPIPFAVELRGEHGTVFLVGQIEHPESLLVPSKSTQQKVLFYNTFYSGGLTLVYLIVLLCSVGRVRYAVPYI